MRARARLSATLATLAVASALSVTAAAQNADPAKAQAQARLREGNALLERGKAAEALQEFTEAYRLFPSPKLHYNMGQAHGSISGHEARAYTEMSRFLSEASDASAELRAAAEAQCQRLRPKIGLIALTVDPPDAELMVDGVAAGMRALDAPLALGIGKHTLMLKKGARVSTPEVISIAGGEATSLRLTLASEVVPPRVSVAPPPTSTDVTPPLPPAPWSAGPPANVVESPTSRDRGGSRWTRKRQIGAGLVALGAASLIFGIVEHVRYFGKADDFRKAGCGTSDLSMGTSCRTLNDDFDSAHVGWIVGYLGAAAVGGAGAYLLWIAPTESPNGGEGASAVSMNSGLALHFQSRF